MSSWGDAASHPVISAMLGAVAPTAGWLTLHRKNNAEARAADKTGQAAIVSAFNGFVVEMRESNKAISAELANVRGQLEEERDLRMDAEEALSKLEIFSARQAARIDELERQLNRRVVDRGGPDGVERRR